MQGVNLPEELRPILLSWLADCGVAIALFDPDDKLRFANQMFRDALGITGEDSPTWEAIMRSCHANKRGLVINSDDIDTWIAKINTRRRKIPVRQFQSDLVDGRWLWVTETTRPDGWVLIIGSDISLVKHTERRLREARDSAVIDAYTDVLTGLFNRRYINARLAEMLTDAIDSGAALTLCILDIDYFKQINDRYGHLAGDSVLQHFATLLRHKLRPSDLVGRVGGEEFILLMPGTQLEDGARAVERLLRSVRASRNKTYTDVKYTFSAGLACVRTEDTATSLVARADKALYAAKEEGRNRLVLAVGPD